MADMFDMGRGDRMRNRHHNNLDNWELISENECILDFALLSMKFKFQEQTDVKWIITSKALSFLMYLKSIDLETKMQSFKSMKQAAEWIEECVDTLVSIIDLEAEIRIEEINIERAEERCVDRSELEEMKKKQLARYERFENLHICLEVLKEDDEIY